MSESDEQPRNQHQLSENSCVVCYKATIIYSIGVCNHPVCFECSARMRCLCLQNECPICRQDLPKVIFTKFIDQFSSLDRNIRSGLFEKKYKILFGDLDIQRAFYYLLEHRCPECDERERPYADFNKLKEHVRRSHELFYCEICTDNLTIFSSERRCYNRSDLATHRRIGDADNKSHKGHPRCEYCELRYLDKDELFRHLRREHYFCHLCDADGKNLYFATIHEMRLHFKAEHNLCEEPECLEGEFFAVFRSEIDLKAHRATVHSRGMSKAEVRQARTLEIEFSYGPRGRGGGGGGGGNDRGQRRNYHNNNRDNNRDFRENREREFESNEIAEQQIIQQPPIKIDAKSEEQFPSLAGPATSTGSSQVQLSNSIRHVVYGQGGLAKTRENYPTLGGEKAQSKPQQGSSGQEQQKKSYKQQSASSLFKTTKQAPAQQQQSTSRSQPKMSDFPTLPTQNASKLFSSSLTAPPPPMVSRSLSSTSSQSSNLVKVPSKVSDFPALPQNSSKLKASKIERLMEDMIIPSNSNVNLVSSKHRNLVNDYVSVASQVTKVQLVKQKDDLNLENSYKAVPKLNSSNNFPSLGSGSSASNDQSSANLPQWLTVKPTSNNNQKKITTEKVNPKVPSPFKPTANGMKKLNNEQKKPKEKPKPIANKENNAKVPPLPPGFKKSDISTYSKYTYLPEASKRNQALLEECEKILQTNEKMQEFKQLSIKFRSGDYFARSYYESCKGVLGEKFNTIFPELIALLPDIEKQQKLYRIHLEESNNADNPLGRNKKFVLEVCSTCKQVVLGKDMNQHSKVHSELNDFSKHQTSPSEVSARNP